LEIFHAALEKNLVAFLETGCGKTLIAIQLMKQIVSHKLKAKGQKNLIVFPAQGISMVSQILKKYKKL
jgi:ERCC4-related helicase